MCIRDSHRPYITLKWAESADHFIDLERTDGQPVVPVSYTHLDVYKRQIQFTSGNQGFYKQGVELVCRMEIIGLALIGSI